MKKLESVLLVDDDEITNFINEQIIQDMSVAEEILVATNGKEGIEVVENWCQSQKTCPELIFLDINMPVMDGFEFLEAYQQKHSSTHRPKSVVVMLTSSNNPEDIEKTKQSNIADYLIKPLTEDKINNVLKKHFTNKSWWN